jgi:peptidoglycan/xylan/chitin deacetylase (PgdA/CDA1 family)
MTNPNMEALPNGLYCFNYHRVGDKNKTIYDQNVFSCNTNEFEQHLKFYKDNFRVVTMSEIDSYITNKTPITDRMLLITFDDGYVDNYHNAYPLLKKYGLTATFFIATDYIGNNILTWWDEIAFIVNVCQLTTISVPFGKKVRIDIDCKKKATRKILREFKHERGLNSSEKLALLRDVCVVEKCAPPALLFMDLRMLLEMTNNGMDIGSHTCTHQILSHLDYEQQAIEITKSKNFICEYLKVAPLSFSYPVGSFNSYNKDSISLLKEQGFNLAFNFEKGVNTSFNNPYELTRYPVDNNYTVDDMVKMIYLSLF